MSTVSSTVNALQKQAEAHKVTASFDPDNLEDGIRTTKITGDRESGLFTKETESQKMQFLTLLTEQLKHQDPTAPMDNTEFVAQLAQFTQLDATTSMEATMTKMAEIFEKSMDLQNLNSQSTTNAASVSLVGKKVRLRENSFKYNGGSKAMEFNAHLGENSKAVVHIVDGDGYIVKSIKLGEEGNTKDASNAVKFSWDGKDDTGQKVPADTYNLIIEGQEKDDSLYCFVENVVTGIRYSSNGTALVRVDNKEVPVPNLLEVANFGGTSSDASAVNTDLSMAQALGMVGLDVKVKVAEKLPYEPDPNKELGFKLDLGGEKNATLLVKDKDGNTVDTILINEIDLHEYSEINDVSFGTFSLPQKGYGSGTDKYTVEIAATSKTAYFYDDGPITGVVMQNGYPQLKMANRYISIGDIMEMTTAKKTS